MGGTNYFGYRCPQCGTTVDIGVDTTGDTPRCPNCRAEMRPDPNGRASATNVYCPRCNIAVGLVNSDHCPDCGGPWSPAG